MAAATVVLLVEATAAATGVVAAEVLLAGVVAFAEATTVLGAPLLAVGEGVVFFSSTGAGSVRARRKSCPNFLRSVLGSSLPLPI